jgi:hypothetical protein
MDTVSENMMVGISLGPHITCEYICQHIQKLFDYCSKNQKDLSNSVLSIRIIDTVTDTTLIPKLEYKHSPD